MSIGNGQNWLRSCTMAGFCIRGVESLDSAISVCQILGKQNMRIGCEGTCSGSHPMAGFCIRNV